MRSPQASVGEQDRNRHGGEQRTRGATHHPLAHAAVSIRAHDDQIRVEIGGCAQDDVTHVYLVRAAGLVFRQRKAMAGAVRRQVFERHLRAPAGIQVVRRQNGQGVRIAQKRSRVGDRTSGLPATVPAIQHPAPAPLNLPAEGNTMTGRPADIKTCSTK